MMIGLLLGLSLLLSACAGGPEDFTTLPGRPTKTAKPTRTIPPIRNTPILFTETPTPEPEITFDLSFDNVHTCGQRLQFITGYVVNTGELPFYWADIEFYYAWEDGDYSTYDYEYHEQENPFMPSATACPLSRGLESSWGDYLAPGDSAYVGTVIHLPRENSNFGNRTWDYVTQFKFCVWLIASEFPSERLHEVQCVDVSHLLADLVDRGGDGEPGALNPTKTTKPPKNDSSIPTIAPFTPPSITLEPMK